MQRVSVQCSGSQFPSSVARESPMDGRPICVCRQGLYHEAHSPPVTDTVHASKQCCRGSLRHYISRVLQSPLPCPKEIRRLETSHRPLISHLLPRDSPLPDGECRKHSAISPSRCLGHFHRSCGYLFPHTHPQVTKHFFDFRLWTPYTNSRHCRLVFLQHQDYDRDQNVVHVIGINLSQYLDDWLIYSPSHDQCLRDTVQLINLCHTMDLIHDNKSELIPKQNFLFLRYQFDLVSLQVTPTLDRYHKSSTDLLILAKPRRMCSYAGDPARSLASTEKMVPSLGFQCFNQQLVDTSFPHGGGRFPKVEVSTQCCEGSPSYPDRTRHSVVHGCIEHQLGSTLNALTVSGVCTTTEKTLHINVLELEAIHRAMLHWLRKLMGLTVLVASDNSTVVSYINKQGRTRSIQLCRWTKKLLLVCQANIIVLRHDTSPGDWMSLQTFCHTLRRC